MSPRTSCTSTQWHSLKSEFEEQFKELQRDIAKEYHTKADHKSNAKSKIKTYLKKKSNKVHHLDMDGGANNKNNVRNVSATNDECLSIISVDLNTENIYDIRKDENVTQTFRKRRMSQP